MLTACDAMQSKSAVLKCRSGFSDEKIAKLKTKTALVLCREEQLCKPGEKPVELEENGRRIGSYEAIPAVDAIPPNEKIDFEQLLESGQMPKSPVNGMSYS